MGLDMYMEAKKTLSTKIKRERILIQQLNELKLPDSDFQDGGKYLASYNAVDQDIIKLIESAKLFGRHGQLKYIDRFRNKLGSYVWSIETEVSYWRKENHIHHWFVTHNQNGEDDCDEYQVSYDTLIEFIKTAKLLLMDEYQAYALMPTKSGFFFGGTDYNQYYYQSVKRTMKLFERLLKHRAFVNHWTLYYHSSW